MSDSEYIGIDKDGAPVCYGDHVEYDGEVWHVGYQCIVTLAGPANRQKPLIEVGTINTKLVSRRADRLRLR